MKRLFFLVVLMSASFAAFSDELSAAALQGKWKIVESAGMTAEEMGVGEDFWEFKGDKWIVHSGGVSMRPETFSVIDDRIDFGMYGISVTEFTGSRMVTDMRGMVQVLEKVK